MCTRLETLRKVPYCVPTEGRQEKSVCDGYWMIGFRVQRGESRGRDRERKEEEEARERGKGEFVRKRVSERVSE